MDEKNVYLEEINQLHNAVCDFSHQSVTIKKLSITIYISYLSIIFAFNSSDKTCPKGILFLIGFIIPIFCYLYELYIDYTRQSLRARMDNIFIKLELSLGMTPRVSKNVKFILFGLNICRKSKCHSNSKLNIKSFYYVKIFHLMYFIYLLEILTTIVVGTCF